MKKYKEILKKFEGVAGKGVLQSIAREFRFDYNGEDFFAVESFGKISPKQFLKAFEAWTGEAVSDYRVAVLMRDDWRGRVKFKVARAGDDGALFNPSGCYFSHFALDTFYRLSDLNELRKNHSGAWYVFAQKYDTLRAPAQSNQYGRDKIEAGERVKVSKTEHCYTDSTLTQKRISTTKFMREDGRKGVRRWERYEIDGCAEPIDKSGYNVAGARYALRRRAEALRAEREKKKADEMNTGAQVAQLRSRADAIREKIGLFVAYEATKAGTLEAVSKCLSKWGNDLPRVYDLIENHEQREQGNEYKTPEQKQKRLSLILEIIEAVETRFEDAKTSAEGGNK